MAGRASGSRDEHDPGATAELWQITIALLDKLGEWSTRFSVHPAHALPLHQQETQIPADLYVYRPPDDEWSEGLPWRVNGFPLRLWIWSAEEWQALTPAARPVDAQHHLESNVWCVLRML